MRSLETFGEVHGHSTRGSKMKRLFHLLAVLSLALGFAFSAPAQSTPYPSANLPKLYEDFLAKINAIPIYDNHAHPGYADDSDVDSMAAPPVDSSRLGLRADSPESVPPAK